MLIKTEIIFLPRNRLLTCCLQRMTLNISDITIGKGRLISASAASSFISNTSCLRCIVRLSGIYENNGIALPAWESILEALTWTLPKKKTPHKRRSILMFFTTFIPCSINDLWDYPSSVAFFIDSVYVYDLHSWNTHAS